MEDIMEDFNQPSPERIDLLKRLGKNYGSVTPHFWAACQICDLGALEKMVHQEPYITLGIDALCSQMIWHWGSPRVQSRPSTPRESIGSCSGLSPSPLLPPLKKQKTLDSPVLLRRDPNIKKLAEERDSYSCVLTGINVIRVIRIYPHHLIKQKEEDQSAPRHTFWNLLRAFWPKEKVTTWEAKLFPQGIGEKGQEEVYNLICLSPTVHETWRRGLFALKPISESDDKKTLKVQFFWQEKQQIPLRRMSLTTTPISTRGLQQTTGAHGGHIWLFDKDGNKIESGDCFELRTNDPIQKPLPSFELLELQWFLQRIQGMAGGADIDIDWTSFSEPGFDSDDEICEENCDVPDLELNAVGGLS